MIARLVFIVACVAVLITPFTARPYHTTLMLPAFGYGVALLGLNLLFGYTGLLSFGHALFLALGAYTAAVLTTHAGVLRFETILMTADRKSTRLNSSHIQKSRMPSSA